MDLKETKNFVGFRLFFTVPYLLTLHGLEVSTLEHILN